MIILSSILELDLGEYQRGGNSRQLKLAKLIKSSVSGRIYISLVPLLKDLDLITTLRCPLTLFIA